MFSVKNKGEVGTEWHTVWHNVAALFMDQTGRKHRFHQLCRLGSLHLTMMNLFSNFFETFVKFLSHCNKSTVVV